MAEWVKVMLECVDDVFHNQLKWCIKTEKRNKCHADPG